MHKLLIQQHAHRDVIVFASCKVFECWKAVIIELANTRLQSLLVQVLSPVQYARYLTQSFPFKPSIFKISEMLADEVRH